MPAARSPRPIVVVKTGDPVPNVAAHRGDFARMIEATIGALWPHGYGVVDVRTERPPDPRAATAFVITGSASNVPTRERWMLDAEAWLREAAGSLTPIFGICFGHQLLGQALGGEVVRNPRGREIGTIHIERTVDDPLFEGIPRRFEANATHIDTVAVLPAGATSLARSSLEDNHVIRFSPTCVGVQFHPEIDAEIMRGYIESRREILASEGFAVDAMLASVGEADAARTMLRNFVRRIAVA